MLWRYHTLLGIHTIGKRQQYSRMYNELGSDSTRASTNDPAIQVQWYGLGADRHIGKQRHQDALVCWHDVKLDRVHRHVYRCGNAHRHVIQRLASPCHTSIDATSQLLLGQCLLQQQADQIRCIGCNDLAIAKRLELCMQTLHDTDNQWHRHHRLVD
jgi:hypothetical protein